MKRSTGKGMVFAGVAFELVGLCVGGFLFGELIDEKMGWKGVASSYLVLILLTGWFVHLIYLLRQFEKDDSD